MYLNNKGIYRIFKTCCKTSVLFSQNAVYSIIVSFFVQIIPKFFTNHVLKFK